MPRHQSPAESTTTHRAKQHAQDQDAGQDVAAGREDLQEHRADSHRTIGAAERDKTSESTRLAPTTSYHKFGHTTVPYERWHFLAHQASPESLGAWAQHHTSSHDSL